MGGLIRLTYTSATCLVIGLTLGFGWPGRRREVTGSPRPGFAGGCAAEVQIVPVDPCLAPTRRG